MADAAAPAERPTTGKTLDFGRRKTLAAPRKRTRSPAPASPKGRSRRELPTHAVEILKSWLTSPQHFKHPYPTPEEQLLLMAQTGIDKKQLKNWFTNARRRIWKPMQRDAENNAEDVEETSYYEDDDVRPLDVLAFAGDAAALARRRAVTVGSEGDGSPAPRPEGLFEDFALDARPAKRGRPDTTCAFCSRDRVDTQLMPCGHLFHGQCLRPWLEATVTTPVCPLCSVAIANCVLASAPAAKSSGFA